MLTENDIKRAFLPFLKEFYKYRYEYRPESVHTELDNVSAGGLIADGMVSFRKADGAPFVCTYEATSADKAEEVKFTLNGLYFMWDCLAFGALTAAVAYAVAFSARQSWLIGLQWTGNTGFVLGMLLVGFFSWYFFMRGWRKYRYIYAIEQFKQYFADEQWIALADDVFPAPTDPYLLELKNQCVYNGFGLALVPARGEIRVLVTPSRVGMYGKDRAMVQWVTQLQWYQAMSHNVSTISKYRPALPGELTASWNKIWRPVRYLLLDPAQKAVSKAFNPAETDGKSATFNRYMRGHGVQKWVFALCLVAITPLFYRVLNVREDVVQDVIEYPEINPEDQYGYLYEGDRLVARDPRAIPKQYPASAWNRPAESDIPTINLSGDNDQEEIPTIDLSGIEDEPAPGKSDPCAAIRNARGWLVREDTYPLKSLADARVATLRQQGLSGEAIPLACVGGKEGYLVRLGKTYTSEAEAYAAAENFALAMDRYGLLRKGPQVLQLRQTN